MEMSISRGGDGGGRGEKSAAIEPPRGRIQSAERSPKAPRLQRRESKSHSGRVDSHQREGRRETEVDQGQFGSPLTHIPPDNTGGN